MPTLRITTTVVLMTILYVVFPLFDLQAEDPGVQPPVAVEEVSADSGTAPLAPPADVPVTDPSTPSNDTETESTPQEDTKDNSWLWLAGIISGAVLWGLSLLLSFIRDRLGIKVDQEALEIDAAGGLLENRQLLLQRVGDTMLRAAENAAQRSLPVITTDALDGGGFDWKQHLNALYVETRDETLAAWKDEGYDLIQLVGRTRLRGMIERALNTAINSLPERVSSYVPQSVRDHMAGFAASFIETQLDGLLDDTYLSEDAEDRRRAATKGTV